MFVTAFGLKAQTRLKPTLVEPMKGYHCVGRLLALPKNSRLEKKHLVKLITLVKRFILVS
jgi:hypothetical protein